MKVTERDRKAPPSPLDQLEQELRAIEARRDAIEAALVSARGEQTAMVKARDVVAARIGEEKADAQQFGQPEPSLDGLMVAEAAVRAADAGVAVLESRRAEIEKIWKAARLRFLDIAIADARAQASALQADFNAIGVERHAANQAFDQREREISAQLAQVHDEALTLQREADNLRRLG